MKVYQVWDWDPMASSMGDEYLAGTFKSKAAAEKMAKRLNDSARKSWMATASEEGKKNYRDQASVRTVTVK